MEVVGKHTQENNVPDEVESGNYYELLVCPVCRGICLQRTFYADWIEPGEHESIVLYPPSERIPLGLPDSILTAYQAALKVRSIDPNLYAVQLRKVLELMCQDRKANGANLHQRLQNLSKTDGIPPILVEMALNVKDWRNIGAHASGIELSIHEIPFMDEFCRAVLEYVYSGPDMVRRAQERLEDIKKLKVGLDEKE